MAQLVEHRSPKPRVTGSIPVWPAILFLWRCFMSKFNLGKAFGNLREEYKKIYWAGKAEVFHVTVIVLLITLFVAIYTVIFDTGFNFILLKLTNTLKSFLGGA